MNKARSHRPIFGVVDRFLSFFKPANRYPATEAWPDSAKDPHKRIMAVYAASGTARRGIR
jgi:hypothetical protein